MITKDNESMGNLDNLKENQKQHGGKRPGAGRKLHSKNPETIEREEALRQFKERVAKSTDRIFNSQLDLAVGEKYLMVVRTIGKGAKQRRETEVVTNPDTIKAYLDETLDDTDEEYYFMTTKPANNQALEALMNRAYGKPKESIEIEPKGGAIPVALVEFIGSERKDDDSSTDN